MAIKLLFNADSLELYALRVCTDVHYKNWFTIKCGNLPTNTTRKLSFRLLSRFYGTSQFWTIGFMANVQCQLKWDFINLINNLMLNSIHSILDQWWQYRNVPQMWIERERTRMRMSDAYKFLFVGKLRAIVNEHRMECFGRAQQRNEIKMRIHRMWHILNVKQV